MQDTSALAVKSDQETHTTCLSLEGYFISVDVFFSETIVYICILFESVLYYGLKFSFSYLFFDIFFLQKFQIIQHNIFLNH
jgi:hypothetical protein